MAELLEQRSSISLQLIDALLEVFGEFNQLNIWSKVTKDDFTVKRFDLGNDSNLCCCQLTETAKSKLNFSSPKDCEGVVVKFLTFGDNGITDNGLSLADIVAVNTVLSINQISPKLLFANSKCYVHEYIKSRIYTFENDDNPEVVKCLARILAKFHSLDAPISNNAYKTSQKSYEDFFNRRKHIYGWGNTEATGQKYLKALENHPEIKEQYYDEFAKIDYHSEIVYVQNLKERLDSPIVFAHSDFNRGNRLVVKDSKDQLEKIYLIDFDATSMNNRGVDFGDYFSNYRHREDFANEGFPSDEDMALFLNEYREKCAQIFGTEFLDKKENSLEHMIDEAKIYTLGSYIGGTFFGLMWYQEAHDTGKGQYFLNVAKNQSRGYNRLKKRFIEDGTIPRILQMPK
ncbi:PREDICTED: ethanolamine kinase-like [Rhagoletis zephyria]|uniref:ethanolamine kinase-like n=1 Tax=Rhagoletis zephyria TaxID=28612 RepID=UPI0008119DBE|nr:PREDICTED: ethanolamine kinase-like [Rhagoletis zephyria]